LDFPCLSVKLPDFFFFGAFFLGGNIVLGHPGKQQRLFAFLPFGAVFEMTLYSRSGFN